MAAASDDDEMNYWPGFVDALSTMTMMLIFLMLILSLVIVSVSQNVSKSQIMAIAKAAKVDMSGVPSSVESLTAQVIDALTQLSYEKQKTSQVPRQQLAKGAPDSETMPLSDENPIPEPQRLPPDTRIQSDKTAERESLDGKVEVKSEPAMITLIFQPRALRPDDDMNKKFHNFVIQNLDRISSSQIEIQAIANTGSGQVTEARRLAYYRAMVARQMLIDEKIDPQSVKVTVVDVPSDDQLDYVKIISKFE